MFIKQAPNNESAWNFLSGILFDVSSLKPILYLFIYLICRILLDLKKAYKYSLEIKKIQELE